VRRYLRGARAGERKRVDRRSKLDQLGNKGKLLRVSSDVIGCPAS